MNFYDRLTRETRQERQALLATPVITDCMAGRVALDTYIEFLTEAYHHVRHTVPLLMACGSHLPEHLGWLQAALVEYIEEEHGHERWILNDLAACGVDSGEQAARGPRLATELMVAYAYDTIARGNPVGFFGMVYVLEGTSVAIATAAADIIRQELQLPVTAFTYLRSHGSVDQKHIGDYQRIVNRLERDEDRNAVLHAARAFFHLYADVFRQLPRAEMGQAESAVRSVA